MWFIVGDCWFDIDICVIFVMFCFFYLVVSFVCFLICLFYLVFFGWGYKVCIVGRCCCGNLCWWLVIWYSFIFFWYGVVFDFVFWDVGVVIRGGEWGEFVIDGVWFIYIFIFFIVNGRFVY